MTPKPQKIAEFKNLHVSYGEGDNEKELIGSTTIYAFMQACGMVDDHENGCFCKGE